MELRSRLANLSQDTQTITVYMQNIKTCIDSLALMNKSVDFDDLSIRILDGLDPAYSNLPHALQVQDSPLEFKELFKILLNYEAHLRLLNPQLVSPVTARLLNP